MVQRVLVAVDGSPASQVALEIACALAEKYEAALGLLSVTEPGVVTDQVISAAQMEGVLRPGTNYWSVSDAVSSSSYAEESKRAESATLLASLLAEQTVATAKAYSSDTPFHAIKTFVASGDPGKEIVACAENNAADIIIMGHDQQGRVEALFKSSVAEYVQAKATCPVLIYSLPKSGN